PLNSFTKESVVFREEYARFSPAEIVKFNYLLRSDVRDSVIRVGDSEQFIDLYGVYPEEYVEGCYIYALDKATLPTTQLFQREAEYGRYDIQGLEATVREKLSEQAERGDIGEITKGALSIGRHLAAAVIEVTVDGQELRDIAVLLASARRLEMN